MYLKRNSASISKSFWKEIRQFKPAEQVMLYNALFAYAFDGEETELSGVPLVIYNLACARFDENNKKYWRLHKKEAEKQLRELMAKN